jgi:hypothetical protein
MGRRLVCSICATLARLPRLFWRSHCRRTIHRFTPRA